METGKTGYEKLGKLLHDALHPNCAFVVRHWFRLAPNREEVLDNRDDVKTPTQYDFSLETKSGPDTPNIWEPKGSHHEDEILITPIPLYFDKTYSDWPVSPFVYAVAMCDEEELEQFAKEWARAWRDSLVKLRGFCDSRYFIALTERYPKNAELAQVAAALGQLLSAIGKDIASVRDKQELLQAGHRVTGLLRRLSDIVLLEAGRTGGVAVSKAGKRRLTGERLKDKPLTKCQRKALEVLTTCGGVKTEAAKRLGISRAALDDRLEGAKLRGDLAKRRSVGVRQALATDKRGNTMAEAAEEEGTDDRIDREMEAEKGSKVQGFRR